MREFDLTESCLRRSIEPVAIDQAPAATGARSTAEREELTRLRRDVKRLEMEREILNKAAAFFAKESE